MRTNGRFPISSTLFCSQFRVLHHHPPSFLSLSHSLQESSRSNRKLGDFWLTDRNMFFSVLQHSRKSPSASFPVAVKIQKSTKLHLLDRITNFQNVLDKKPVHFNTKLSGKWVEVDNEAKLLAINLRMVWTWMFGTLLYPRSDKLVEKWHVFYLKKQGDEMSISRVLWRDFLPDFKSKRKLTIICVDIRLRSPFQCTHYF